MSGILILLAQGFEEIEAITVIDLLRRAGIEVTTASLTGDMMVTGSHNVTIKADVILDKVEVDDFDGIFLPGGQPGSKNLKENSGVLDLLRLFNEQRKWVTAICAAPLVLKEAGIISGKHITSYPATKEAFKPQFYREESVVTDGHIITSRGVGTAIDFSLTLIEIFKGKEERVKQAERILWK